MTASPVHAAIGAAVRHHRKRKGLRIADLAEQIGTTGAVISRWERGREFMPFARREQVAGHLGLDPARLAEPRAIEVTAEEAAHLDHLRRLPSADRDTLFALAAESCPQERS